MTRLDAGAETQEAPVTCDGPRALLLSSREVPLGGVRGMQVYRALPQRELPMVGAWCFLDRFGPQRTKMSVEPHPHIGLQTVTWPFEGQVQHRDSVGSDVIVQRGVLNLMTSGRGISHSEYSLGDGGELLDALQLWVALPEASRHAQPAFERHENLPVVTLAAAPDTSDAADSPHTPKAAASAIVVMGEFAGAVSPATAHTPIVGAEIQLPAGTRVRLPLTSRWEHALLAVDGTVDIDTLVPVVTSTVGGAPAGAADAAAPGTSSDAIAPSTSTPALAPGELMYLGVHRDYVDVTSTEGATVFLLGGEPFEADIVMWWNFVGRSHDEIVLARDEWEAEADPASAADRFGRVSESGGRRIPAPPLPHVRLMPRRRRV